MIIIDTAHQNTYSSTRIFFEEHLILSGLLRINKNIFNNNLEIIKPLIKRLCVRACVCVCVLIYLYIHIFTYSINIYFLHLNEKKTSLDSILAT